MSSRVAPRIAVVSCAAALLGACGMFGPDRAAVVVAPPPPPPTMMQPAPPQQMAPMQVAPAPSVAPAPARSAALAGHLASYKSAESAQAGWQQLVRRQPALQTLKPYFVPVTISGQPWVRVLAGDFPNAEEVNRFCNWARAQSLYCVPMPVNGAAQATPPRTAAAARAASDAASAPRAAARDPAAILAGGGASAPASTKPGADPFTYYVQTGAFRRSEDADQQRAALAIEGFQAKVNEREQAGQVMFRVRLGPYDSRDEAEGVQDKVRPLAPPATIVRVEKTRP